MKPAPFKYIEVEDEAALIEALDQGGEECRLLAGGQSLVPMMNFRIVSPAIIVDVNRIGALSFIELDSDKLRIGALTRHAMIEDSGIVGERWPLLVKAVRHVAHRAIRNRGTLGGTVALAYPGAEMPLALTVLDADLELRSKRGLRRISVREFILGALDTALEGDEYIAAIEVRLPPANCSSTFVEASRRHGDFAIAAAAAVVGRDTSGKVTLVRSGVSGGTGAPVRLRELEQILIGDVEPDLKEACRAAIEAVEVFGDHHYPADYRRYVLAGLLERALRDAIAEGHNEH